MVSGRELKAALPEVVRVGNVDALLLQREDAATVERVARAAARDFDIVSPACGLVPTTPAENLRAMVRAVRGEHAQT
jgi:uroporphyrinogen-III decarboxylase